MQTRARLLSALSCAAALLSAGCAGFGSGPAEPQPEASAPEAPDSEVYRRADAERIKVLEREVERLRTDVDEAEAALVSVESGLRGSQTRAEAVSSLAEARIRVERAGKEAPWRAEGLAEARRKLGEADRQLAEGHVGAAIFFASRASRIAASLLAEGQRVEKHPGTRFTKGARVNLRAQPSTEAEIVSVLPSGIPVFPESTHGEWILVRTTSGHVGWVNAALVRSR